MKKVYLALAGAAMPLCLCAQSAIDAQQVTQSDFRGSARYMAMGGAFTALGGELSSINQNPAGIGVYRSSEVGVTLNLDFQSTQTPGVSGFRNDASQTKAFCNNFGYVGSTLLDGAMRSFNWGVTFNRASSFDRVYNGYVPVSGVHTSLSNYVADLSYGVYADDMGSSDWNKYDPYLDSDIDWLSILAYNSYLINPVSDNTYEGLYKSGSQCDALYSIREKGHVDEWNINFGGNVEDVVYWGLGIGITDVDYRRFAFYSESLANANVPYGNGTTNGSFAYDLDNEKHIYGTGWNIKAGVIIRPTNEFRIGLAVHTPTFTRLRQNYSGQVTYRYTPTDMAGTAVGETVSNASDPEYTDRADFNWELNAPWRFMVGVAGVLGGRAIVSADYEFAGYNSMSLKNPYYYDDFGNGHDYVTNDAVNDDISTYFKAQNTVRLGFEYRVSPQFSVRAGYNVRMSNVKKDTYDGRVEVLTAGTDPSYTFDNTTQHISFGLGYRYQAWYIDAAYVYKNRESTYHAYTNWSTNVAPSAKVTDHNSSVVISTGFKF